MSSFATQTSTSPTPTTFTSDASTITAFPSLVTSWELPALVQCHYTFDIADLDQYGNSSLDSISAWLDLNINEAASTFSCYPPGMFDGGNSGTFSPALCPMSWTTVAHTEAGDVSGGVTTRTCCSDGFQLDTKGACVGSFASVTATPASFISSLSSYAYLTENVTVLPYATVAYHHIAVEFTDDDKETMGLIDDDEIVSSRTVNLPLSAKLGITFGALFFVCLVSLVICLVYRCRKRREVPGHSSPDVEGSERHLAMYRGYGGGESDDGISVDYSRRGSMPPPLMFGGAAGLGKPSTVGSVESSDVTKLGKTRSDRTRLDVTTAER